MDEVQESQAVIERDEHQGYVARFHMLTLVGVLLWLGVLLPTDALLRVRYRGLTLALLAAARLPVLALFVWAFLRTRPSARARLSPRALLAVEIVTMGTVALAQGVLVMAMQATLTTMMFVSNVLLAQGITMPRQSRVGALSLGVTLAAFPLGMLTTSLWSPRFALGMHNPVHAAVFVQSLAVAFFSYLLLVVGGHSIWRLRRQAFEVGEVGRYRLRRRLGRGGKSDVWLAWHPGLKRDVALKVLRGHRANRQAVERFRQEVAATERLTHPNVVRVLDRGTTDDGLLFYAMELVEGVTLAELVARQGALAPARAAYVVWQAARGVGEAHELGLVHRDLKPENLVVGEIGGERDFVKVVDFGLARPVGSDGDGAGSARFIAPEQAERAPAAAGADVFALGAVLFFALSGRAPFDEAGGVSVDARAHGRITVPAGVPTALAAVLTRALAADPAARYADGRALAAALAACLPD